MSASAPFHIAIIGGGISGCVLAIALQRRGISVHLYERAETFKEIGAGVSFNPNSYRAMKQCAPEIQQLFDRLSSNNAWERKYARWFDFLDGYNDATKEAAEAPEFHDIKEDTGQQVPEPEYVGNEKYLFPIDLGLTGHGVHRARFLDGLAELLPKGMAFFGKNFDSIKELENGKLQVLFQDGSTTTADAVIGCDGIRSRVRIAMVGADDPSAYPSYTNMYAFRGLIPMQRAISVLGEDRAGNSKMHLGYKGHILTFPVNNGETLNFVGFNHDDAPWTGANLVKPSSLDEVTKGFQDFGPDVKKLCTLLEPDLDCWAIFDTGEHPLESFYRGRVCLVGDAAHAASPHHGAGAGMCIEDCAALAAILERAQNLLREPFRYQHPRHDFSYITGRMDKNERVPHPAQAGKRNRAHAMLQVAFAAFSQERMPRTQWMVQSARRMGHLYEWMAEGVGDDVERVQWELKSRAKRVWEFDTDKMVVDALQVFDRLAESKGLTGVGRTEKNWVQDKPANL